MQGSTLLKELGREIFEKLNKDKDLSRYTEMEALIASTQPGEYKDAEVRAKWESMSHVQLTGSAITFLTANGVERVKIGKLD